MRRPSGIPLTIAISVIVHIGLFGAATWLPTPARIAPEKPVAIELVPPTPLSAVPVSEAPIDVVFFDSSTEVAAAPLVATTTAKPTIEAPTNAISSPTPSTTLSTEPSSSEPGPPQPGPTTAEPGTTTRNPYLDMRRAPSPRIAVRGWDDLEHVPKGTAPEKDISTGKLAPDGGGTHKSDQGAFVAKIDKDGSVKLRDKRNFNIHLALPSAKDLGDLIQAWYYDPNKPVGTLGPPNKAVRPENLTREDVSGAERLDGNDEAIYGAEHGAAPLTGGASLPIAAGGFDIGDALMRSKGIDPYASKKLAFLDSTRDERVQIGMKYKSEQLAQVAQIVKKNLARVWAATTDPQQRKQALFEMWDECVESGREEVVHAAATARKIIVGFMRANFPVGSAHEYTATEIAACNRAKASRATFSPYE